MSRLRALWANWHTNPPVHKLVARFVGYKPPAKEDVQPGGALTLMFPQGQIKTG